MIKVVIVDDEIDAVKSVELVLKNYCTNVKVVGIAHSALQGIKVINEKKPDLVLLDIDMPHGSGFDLLEGLPERKFLVIFVTAYNEFAIKAFKVNAIDYILKPLDIDDLITAVEKAEKLIDKNKENLPDYESLLKTIKPIPCNKISIPTRDAIEFIDPCEIIYIEGDGSYSKIFFNNRKELLVSKNLKEIQDMLDENAFFRSHNSQIVNLNHVAKFNIKEGGYIEMSNGTLINLSRRRKDEFMEAMSKLSR